MTTETNELSFREKEEHNRWMIRALGDLYSYTLRKPVPLSELADYMKLESAEAHRALLTLQRGRLARKRTRRGVECWEPWDA